MIGSRDTIIADECTDSHSNQEILSICVRFVNLSTPNDPHIKECLVDFIHLERAVIASKVLESLTNVSLSLNPSNIRGQAYDGAAVMSSEKAGVPAKIKEVSPLAFYTHCYCHCLNLSLASACQLHLIGIRNEAFLFLSNSAKRQRYFLEVYLPTCSRTKLVGLCKTRWVERHTCFEVFLEMYVAFLDAMLHPHQHSQLGTNDTWDWDTLVKAQGMMAAYHCGQMEGRFRGETHHTHCLFSLVPSILVTTSV